MITLYKYFIKQYYIENKIKTCVLYLIKGKKKTSKMI